MTFILEALIASSQQIFMVYGNLGNPQVAPTNVYYLPGGQPPYPPPQGQPVVKFYPTAGGQTSTRTYGKIPKPSLAQPTVAQPFLGTPYPGMNTFWNLNSAQQFSTVTPQVPFYQPV